MVRPLHPLSSLALLPLALQLAGPALGASPDQPPSAVQVADGATRAEAAFDGEQPRVALELLADHAEVGPGQAFTAAVRFTLDPDWHVYWLNPGDAGVATDIKLTAEGGTVGEPSFPTPEVFVQPGDIVTHGYSEELLVTLPVTPDPKTTDAVELIADVSFLACRVDCVPGKASLALSVPVGKTVAHEAVLEELNKLTFSRPQTADDAGLTVTAAATPRDKGYTLTIDIAGCSDGCQSLVAHKVRSLVPFPEQGVSFDGVKASPIEGGVSLSAEVAAVAPLKESLRTLVLLERDGRSLGLDLAIKTAGPGGEALEAALNKASETVPPVETATLGAPAAPKQEDDGDQPLTLAYVLMMSLLGGLILNLMPCVFPVLAIKVFSFMETVHESRSARLAHAGAYAAGIVGSMLLLAAVVLGLKVFGTQVGWGFQFQSAGFLVLMCTVLVVFAMSFFDVFVVGIVGASLQGSVDSTGGLKKSVGEGVLAVALSTPCSAPLLGTAVGFALAAGGLTVVLVFTFIGIGLALPFVVLTQAPGLAKLMPRPGNWMVHARFVLGFSLLFAVVWMLWILGRVVGVDGIAAVMVYLLFVAMGAWVYGTVQKKGIGPARIVLAPLTVAAVVAGYFIVPTPAPVDASGEVAIEATGGIEWQAWSPEKVQKTLAEGKPVFVDFTADWCITCKANEKTIITQPGVVKHLHSLGIVPMKADWTRPDERIRKALEENGKAGVPMYLVYNPKQPNKPQVLPEVLTSSLLTEAFDKAAP